MEKCEICHAKIDPSTADNKVSKLLGITYYCPTCNAARCVKCSLGNLCVNCAQMIPNDEIRQKILDNYRQNFKKFQVGTLHLFW